MKNEIPKFLKEKFKLRHAVADKFPNEIKQFMYGYYDYYNWTFDKTLKNIFLVIRQDINVLPKCEYEGCNKLCSIQLRGKHTKILKSCCVAHSQKLTMLEKYGVDNPSKVKEFRDKVKAASLKKYGTEYSFQAEEVKDKIKNTMLEKYGVEHASQNPEILRKQQNTMIERYGYKSPMQCDFFREKAKKTNLEKYGDEWNLGCEELRLKGKKTMKEKYGVEHSMQNKVLQEKAKKTNLEKYGVTNVMQCARIAKKHELSGHNHKIYTWKTGEKVYLQGYEPIVLQELENNGYCFNDIKTDKTDMPEIWYEYEGKKHRYYPDFYIPEENLIIEVKSEWTMLKEFNKNLHKFSTVKKYGFQFKLEVR